MTCCTNNCRQGRDCPARAPRRFDWMGLASKATAALLIVLSGSLGIALLADHFIF